MAGLFPGISNSQNVDRNGVPLAFSILSVFQGGTQTLASCFQDIGLAIPSPNPMTADQNARLPIFYVADGVYSVRLIDATGIVIYNYPQVAAIGASASGGGGSAVDPTTVFQTGDPLWLPRAGARTGWVRMNGRTIGSGTSGASERSNADCQALFLELWNDYTDAKCPVVGGRGATALADWNANKQITLPDMRGRGPFGLDGMGNSRANIIPNGNIASVGDTADTTAAFGGAANHTLTVGEIPALSYAGSTGTGTGTATAPGISVSVTDPGHLHTIQYDRINVSSGFGATVIGNINPGGGNTTSTTQNASTGLNGINIAANLTSSSVVTVTALNLSMASNAGGGAHALMPPFELGTWYIKQ